MNIRNRPVLFVLCIVALLVASACGSSASTVGGDTDAPAQTTNAAAATTAPAVAGPVLDGTSLPPFEGGADPAIGTPAPNINIMSLKSAPISIDQADGRGKVYAFFAHWCPHCQAELPRLVSYLDANGLPEGVDFHAVSTAVNAERGNYPPVAWFGTENWPYDVLADTDENEIAQGFGLSGFPYFVIVGGDGAVVERIAGELPDEAAVAAVLKTAAESAS